MHHAHVPCAMRMCICARAPPASMPSARAYTHTLSCACVCRLKIACMYVYVAPAWTMAYCHGRLPLLMAACLLSAGTTTTRQRSGRGDKLTVHVHTHTQCGQRQFQHAMEVIFGRLATFCHSRLANRPASSMMGVCLLCLVFIMGAPSVFSRTWTGSRPQVLAQVATKMDIAQTQDHAMCRKHFAAQTCLKDVCAM